MDPFNRLIRAAQDSSDQKGYKFRWIGGRVPERIAILDPDDPQNQKSLFDFRVGYMRDGMIIDENGCMVGTYERTIDFEQQPDGSWLNEILFYLVDDDEFGKQLLS